ncbi:MAG: hypothetical protein OXF22_07260 [Anaerolineaceae bacterium]|nr:hypothetical protein [Anaerolineaceae bacterium]
MLHDYIYLDIERVRSYYAQLSKGLSEGRIQREETEGAGEASAGLSIPLTPIKAEGSLDFRYRRSSEETFSLHDYIVEDFLKLLREKKLLTDLSEHPFDWKPCSFQDGMFILAHGAIRIIDYKYIVSTLENLPEIEKLINKISRGNQQNRSGQQGSNQRPNLDGGQVKKIVEFIDKSIQDTFRLKIYPGCRIPEQHFTASADPNLFRINPDALTNSYGSIINANWLCLLLVNQGSENTHAVNHGSQIEDGKFNLESALEVLTGHLSTFTDMLQGVEFPAIAAVPVAIYREIKTS